MFVLSGLFLLLSYTAFSQCPNPYSGNNTEVCGNVDKQSVVNYSEHQDIRHTGNITVNIDLKKTIKVYYHQQITGKSRITAFVIISEQLPGSNGQVIFQNLKPGNYFLSSLLSHPESYPHLIENDFFNNYPVIDDAAVFISDGSVFQFDINPWCVNRLSVVFI